MSQLIEGFENWSGSAPVGWVSNRPASTAQSTLHVTQGTYSAYLTSSGGDTTVLLNQNLYTPAGVYALDYYVTSATAGSALRLSLGANLVSTTTVGSAGTLYLTVPEPVYGLNLSVSIISTSFPGITAYVDNLRYDPIVVMGSTKEFKLTKLAPSILLDTITTIPSTKGYSLQYGTITATTDVVVKMTDTLRFELGFDAGAADWLPADWNYPDWSTVPTSSGFNVFVDTVANIDDTKRFNLRFSPITVVGDIVVTVPGPKQYQLTMASDINAYTALIVRPDTFRFVLTPQEVEAYSEVYKDYVVMQSSPFEYEILGVNVGTVDGGGRMTVFVDDQIIASDIAFDPTKTNIPLSGIINRGQRLWVGIYMKNGYFRSFDATFALKRTQT